mmetsp:Transcript_20500/g.69733  ORF Transcript_20500/g.69733 Transcript_20500/m.69733 type:complete len:222 (+) Transcript_20500:4452-5117(+)
MCSLARSHSGAVYHAWLTLSLFSVSTAASSCPDSSWHLARPMSASSVSLPSGPAEAMTRSNAAEQPCTRLWRSAWPSSGSSTVRSTHASSVWAAGRSGCTAVTRSAYALALRAPSGPPTSQWKVAHCSRARSGASSSSSRTRLSSASTASWSTILHSWCAWIMAARVASSTSRSPDRASSSRSASLYAPSLMVPNARQKLATGSPGRLARTLSHICWMLRA